MRQFRFRRLAEADLEQAAAYYTEHAGEDVAQVLRNAARNAVLLLCEQPFVGAPAEEALAALPKLRSWTLRGFPCRIFYLVAETEIEIIRVLHDARSRSEETRS